ncbi:MAG: hypothetical protein JJU02_16110 [Cryomorphaceae bacterium]|nr:hypothetical protein [Cryomorphaceae bacterium]
MLKIWAKEKKIKIQESEGLDRQIDFEKKIQESEEQVKTGEYKVLDTNDVWGSLGL